MAIPMPVINFKRNNVFSYAGYVKMPFGNYIAACTMRDADDQIIYNFQVTFTNPASAGEVGTLLLFAPSPDTALWPLGYYYADVEFTNQDNTNIKLYSPTFAINVIEEITNV